MTGYFNQNLFLIIGATLYKINLKADKHITQSSRLSDYGI